MEDILKKLTNLILHNSRVDTYQWIKFLDIKKKFIQHLVTLNLPFNSHKECFFQKSNGSQKIIPSPSRNDDD